MANRKAFIDLGHGGDDVGALGNGLRECDINLAVGLRVKYHLGRHNVDIMLSRETHKTVSLQERTRMANNWGADCFVSIHCNSATNISAYGIETFCYKFAYRSLGDSVHARLLADKTLYYTNRGVKEGDFHVVRESNMSACLVEMAFISNERDAQLLRNKQEEYAIAITKGILDYFGLVWKDEVVATLPTQNELYRVRKTWNNAASQIGAYSVLENAKANCPVGYSVYNSKGVVVFTKEILSTPTPAPTPTPVVKPVKEKIDIFYKFDNLPWVRNLQDNAGIRGVNAKNLYIYPSKGEVVFRVSPVNKEYYSWVQNYKTGSGNYDFAGNAVPIDRIQMKLKNLSGYSVKYRVTLTNGKVLPWVYNDSDYAGIRGSAISNIEIEIV